MLLFLMWMVQLYGPDLVLYSLKCFYRNSVLGILENSIQEDYETLVYCTYILIVHDL